MYSSTGCDGDSAMTCLVCTSIQESHPSFAFASVAMPAAHAHCACPCEDSSVRTSESPGQTVDKKDCVQLQEYS